MTFYKNKFYKPPPENPTVENLMEIFINAGLEEDAKQLKKEVEDLEKIYDELDKPITPQFIKLSRSSSGSELKNLIAAYGSDAQHWTETQKEKIRSLVPKYKETRASEIAAAAKVQTAAHNWAEKARKNVAAKTEVAGMAAKTEVAAEAQAMPGEAQAVTQGGRRRTKRRQHKGGKKSKKNKKRQRKGGKKSNKRSKRRH